MAMRKPLQSLKLAACCVNISDGRNLQVIEDIAYAAVADQNTWEKSNVASDEMTGMKSKSVVLGVHSDAIFNRSNITIAAPIEYLATSVYQACLHAFDKITLEHHTDNGHPRLGVVDLIPIHPLSSYVSLEVCGRIAHEIALRLERTVDGTSFYYFGSADKLNRGLFERRKSMNWFSCSSDFQPDLGKQSKRYGTSGIGAIPYMSVLNIMLNTNDLNIGKEIAAAIRERNSQTGLPGIQSMAFKKQNIVEIACNVETHDLQRDKSVFKTQFDMLEETITTLSSERNVSVVGESLRGFTPGEAYELANNALLNGDTSVWKHKHILMMETASL